MTNPSAQTMLELARSLRARRIMRDGGNGNVYDIADEECEQAAEIIERAATAPAAVREALALAIKHIDHMAAFITKANSDYHCGIYSFESLGEDMPGLRAALAFPEEASTAVGEAVGWMARCPETGGRAFAHTEFLARAEGEVCYSPKAFTVEPVFTRAAPPATQTDGEPQS